MSVTLRRAAGLCELESPEADSEARAWKLKAAEFADELVRPLGLALDRLTCMEAVAPRSPLHEFIAQAHWECFTRLTDSSALGGAGVSRMTEYLVLEELAAADAGLAAILIAAPWPFRWAQSAGPAGLGERLGRAYFDGSVSGLSGCLIATANPPVLRAQRDRRGWRLGGVTAVPVAGAATATHAAIACVPEGSDGAEALLILPLDRRGVERWAADGRKGLRAAAAAVLSFADVRIQPDELIGRHGLAPNLTTGARAIEHLAAAIACVGIARSAYEGAARCVAERGTKDAPRIALMRTMLERARGLTRAAHRSTHRRLDAGQLVSPQPAQLARMLATQTAAELARQSLWIAGPGALDRDGIEHLDGSRFRPEKLVRDANEHRIARPGRATAAPRRALRPPAQRSAEWAL